MIPLALARLGDGERALDELTGGVQPAGFTQRPPARQPRTDGEVGRVGLLGAAERAQRVLRRGVQLARQAAGHRQLNVVADDTGLMPEASRDVECVVTVTLRRLVLAVLDVRDTEGGMGVSGGGFESGVPGFRERAVGALERGLELSETKVREGEPAQ